MNAVCGCCVTEHAPSCVPSVGRRRGTAWPPSTHCFAARGASGPPPWPSRPAAATCILGTQKGGKSSSSRVSNAPGSFAFVTASKSSRPKEKNHSPGLAPSGCFSIRYW